MKPSKPHKTRAKFEVRLNGVLMAVASDEYAARRTASFIPGAVVSKRDRAHSVDLKQAIRSEESEEVTDARERMRKTYIPGGLY